MVYIRYFSLVILILFVTGCSTTRTGAVVEDRSLPKESKPQAQQQKQIQSQQDEQVRVYKLEEPGLARPQPLSDIPDEEPAAPVPLDEPVQQDSPAVVALLDDADQYVVSGKKQEAVASIERALRIEPKNPVLWNRLGQLRLQNGEWEQAIAMAKKSNVLATGNRSLQADNWMIIAKARDAQGDKQGAVEAMNNVYQLKN